MLAHEIKNPLSGIRGAAQLLEQSLDENDRMLTRLICEETDRIVSLVERMELFGDERPIRPGSGERPRRPRPCEAGSRARPASPGTSGWSRPTTPRYRPCTGNRDQLIQVCLNLVKNAAEAVGPDTLDGEIVLSTAFRAGRATRDPGLAGRAGRAADRARRCGTTDRASPTTSCPICSTRS